MPKKGEAFKLKPWTEVVRLHPDVESGNTALATYAIDLGALVSGDPNVPLVYRDPNRFFQFTHPTREIRRLVTEVMARLNGIEGDRVIQLRSPFGGGKSHMLAVLYHAARSPSSISRLPGLANLPTPGKVAMATFDGEKFDALLGKEPEEGQKVLTMWGWLAWQVSKERKQPRFYELLKEHDQGRIAPGGDLVAQMLEGGPILLLLDEVLKYLVRASAIQVGKTTLQQLTIDFLDTLVREVARSKNCAIVYSLQASEREAQGNVGLLQMLDHLTSREDAKREPVASDEILPVLKKRLLAEPPDASVAEVVADSYADAVRRFRLAYADSAAARRQAEEEVSELRDRIIEAYPFHPALIDIMRGRWASIPDFQRTRGALRFLAVCMYRSKARREARIVLGPAEIPMEDGDVRQAFFSEVGQMDAYRAAVDEDLTGQNARVKKIDSRLQKESPALANAFPAKRIGTAILLYSFGGLPKEGGAQGETLPPGVTEYELLGNTVGPDLDSITAQVTLKELPQQCLYLHYDGARYAFKTSPNVTKLIEDEAQAVDPDGDITPFIKTALETRLAGQRNAVIWPSDSQQIPDGEPSFLIAYLPLDFADLRDGEKESRAKKILTESGNKPRRYRNGLALGVPSRDQLESLRRSARYLIAIERVDQKKRPLSMSKEQEEQLKERRRSENAGLESSFRSLYTTIWMLSADGSIEKSEASGRPLQASGIQERSLELLTQVTRKVYGSIAPKKIIEIFHIDEPGQETGKVTLGIPTRDVVDAFFSSPGFPRLLNSDVIKRAVIAGVSGPQPTFAYWGEGEPKLGKDGKYDLLLARLSFGTSIQDDEIDLEKGFLISPSGVPEARVSPPPPPPPPPQPVGRNEVTYVIEANRDQLFKAWPALANLAEMAGKVTLRVDARPEKPLDATKLRNAVEEPLDELGVIKKSEKSEGKE